MSYVTDIESGNYYQHQARIRDAHRFSSELEGRVRGDLRKTAKNYLLSTAAGLIGNWARTKMRARNLNKDFSNEASPSVPSTGSSRKRRVVEVVTDAKSGKTKSRTTTQSSASNVSSLITGKNIFDASLLPALAEQQLTTLRIKLGVKEYPDQLKSFLDMCLGVSAKTRTSFAGRISAPVGTRRYHHQVYRHNYSTSDNTTEAVYDATILQRVLRPQTSTGFMVTPSGPSATDTSFREIVDGSVYYSNDNRSDLEDMSWNQARIKLAGEAAGVGGAIMSFQQIAPVFDGDKHARISKLCFANDNSSTFVVGNRPTQGRYKAVINYGKLTYNFMNKGEGGAEVIIVVSKFKKTHEMSSTATDYANSTTYPMGNSMAAIGNGWVDTCAAAYSTQDTNGHRVTPDDVQTNPCYPFLPKLKKTKQGEVDVVEVSRQTFAMPSGARRQVILDLPGLVYDPAALPVATGISSPSLRAIVDSHSYVVTIAVNGTKATRFVDYLPNLADASTGYAIGDMHGPANIQFYASYEENVGPAIYSAPKNIMLANDGGLMDPTDEFVGSIYKKRTGLLIPQDQVVRTTPMVTKTYSAAGTTLTGVSVQEGTATAGNESNDRR